jgi:hypothetical protein
MLKIQIIGWSIIGGIIITGIGCRALAMLIHNGYIC